MGIRGLLVANILAKKAKTCSEAVGFVWGGLNDALPDSYFSSGLKPENSTAVEEPLGS